MPITKPRRDTVQLNQSDTAIPFTWLISTTTFTTVLAAPSGAAPVPTTIAITLFDENNDSVIDSKDLEITLQEQQHRGSGNASDANDKGEEKKKPKQTIAEIREISQVFCNSFSNSGGPEWCFWSSLQFDKYYTGNWTEFCSKDARKSLKQSNMTPPSKKECKKCDPDKGINKRDSVCLRLLFFTWPAEFGTMETPSPTRGLSFQHTTLVSSGAILKGCLGVSEVAFVTMGCVLTSGLLGVFNLYLF